MNPQILSLLLIIGFQVKGIFSAAEGGPVWDYGVNGEDAWHVNFPICKGLKQSPIDILSPKAKYNKGLKPFIFQNYDQTHKWLLKKSGKNFGMTRLDTNKLMGVNGSDLCSFFKVENVHFHWGANDFQGSEHKLNGEKLPLEMHVVHSSARSDNYVVTGLIFQVQAEDNPVLEPFLKAVDELQTKESLEIEFNIFSIYPSEMSLEKYYRYSGSLTTPPCSEVVIWNVFKKPIMISSAQMARIRIIGPEISFRHVQPINGRTLYKSYKENQC